MFAADIACNADSTETLERSFCEYMAAHLAKSGADPIYVLVGSNLLGLHLRKVLVKLGAECFNLRFITFVDLAKKVLGPKLYSQGRRMLPHGAQQAMLRRQLEALDEKNIFYAQSGKPGFVSMLQKHFQNLIDDEKEGHEHLSEIFQHHRRSYLDRFYTPSDLVAEAARVDEPIASLLDSKVLFCYGFYDLTRTQQNLLKKCSESMKVESWSMPMTSAATLDASEENKKNPLASKVTCRSSSNPLAEAQEIVRSVLVEVKKGKRFEDMAILLPSQDLSRVYQRILEKAGVPYFLNGGKSLVDFPHGSAFLMLLDLLDQPSARKEWLDCLGHLPFAPSIVKDVGTPSEWSAWTKEAGLSFDASEFVEKIRAFSSRCNQAQEPFATKLAAFVDFFSEFLQKTLALKTHVTSWTQASQVWLEWVQHYFSNDEVHRKITQVLATLPDMEGTGVTPAMSTILEVLRERLQAASLPQGKFKVGSLYIGPVHPIRCVTFETVYLPSFTDDVYPKKQFVHRWLKTEVDQEVQQDKAYELLWTQAKTFVVSYPRRSLLHQEQYPSSWMKNIQRQELLSWQQAPQQVLDESDWKQTTLSHELLKRKEVSPERLVDFSGLFSCVASWVENRLGSSVFGTYDGCLAEHESFRKTRFSAKHIADFSKCPYQYFLRHVLKLSPSQDADESLTMEKMDRGNMIHDILFRLFTNLKSSGLFPLTPGRRAEVGSMLEEIAGQVFQEVEKTKHVGLPMLWEMEKSWLMQDLASFLELDFEENPMFTPEAFEVRFGMPSRSTNEDRAYSTDEAVDIVLNNGTRLSLYGKMDRVDLSSNKRKARVVDYKTGSVRGTKDDSFMGGQAVQLPIYLLAAEKLFPTVDLSLSQAMLLSTSFSGGFEKKYFGGKVLQERSEEFHRLLQTVVEFHRSGAFFPNPGKEREHCKFCEFRPVCGTSVGRVFERKKSDPKIAGFLELEEIE